MQLPSKIKKRTGQIAFFDPNKISIAVEKAFKATDSLHCTEENIEKITKIVLNQIKTTDENKTPHVEEVQDLVEKALLESGFHEVAKAYILYRFKHQQERQQAQANLLEKIEHQEISITKENGTKENFDFKKIQKKINFASQGNKDIDHEKIAKICKDNLYDGIKTSEISKALILSARSLIEKDPIYSRLASNLLLDIIYQEIIGKKEIDFKDLETQYKKTFISKIKRGIHIGKLDKKLLDFDLQDLSQYLKLERDQLIIYLGLQTLYDRYFIRCPETKELLEAPQIFWMRVAMGLAINEKNKNEKAKEFYDIISTLKFIPSTPTLFHSGTDHPQLSSCYLTTIDDSLENIFKCIGDNAQLSKWSGGIGNDWTSIRGTGSLIKGTGVDSQGVIPFLKIANDTTVAINRSGRRRGATCAYLETWHYDIEDFLELKKNTGDERRRTHDMNTSNWIPDLFIKRVQNNQDWTLFSPDETPELHELFGQAFEKKYEEYEEKAAKGKIKLFKTIKAQNLWRKMITMLFETGHPWITFKDPCNIRSPQDHCGVIHSSNLCTEITLNTSKDETAVCNLGSINLSKHIKDKKLNKKLIKKTVNTAIRMLDNVIDLNFYPTKEAKNSNLRHRPIGLGIMGFQDALYLQDINFDSEECITFADQSMELISYFTISASCDLAKERGAYSTFKGSKWDRGILPLDSFKLLEQERGQKIDVEKSSTLDWSPLKERIKKHGMRNSNCMAIAPTATISNIAGCFPTVEPIFKNMYVKSNMSGEFTIVNPYLIEELKKINLWNDSIQNEIKAQDGSIENIKEIPQKIKDKYKETFDIDPKSLIKAAAYRGKWIDQSQSINMFIKGTSGKIISESYLYSWKMGLKTTYYLRSMAKSGVEKSTVDIKRQQNTLSTRKTEETPIQEPKLCKILDPECEACQ